MILNVTNGTVHYEVRGEGKPVVILHPLATDYRSMEAWLEPIFAEQSSFKRIYVDIPAHGESIINSKVKTTDELLQMVIELIDNILPTQSFLLIGMSFGSYIAQGILCKCRDRVEGIALLVPVTQVKERNVPNRVILQKEEGILEGVDEEVGKAFDILLANQTKETLQLFLQEFQPGRLLANREFLSSSWRTEGYHFSFDCYQEGEVFPQKALILTGRNDYVCGYKDSFQLLDYFPHGSFAVIDNSGHLLPIEQRQQVVYHVSEWLKRV